jgi:hypothetical protein
MKLTLVQWELFVKNFYATFHENPTNIIIHLYQNTHITEIKSVHIDVFYGCCFIYSSAAVSTGNMFQDLPWLCETADNTEHYI